MFNKIVTGDKVAYFSFLNDLAEADVELASIISGALPTNVKSYTKLEGGRFKLELTKSIEGQASGKYNAIVKCERVIVGVIDKGKKQITLDGSPVTARKDGILPIKAKLNEIQIVKDGVRVEGGIGFLSKSKTLSLQDATSNVQVEYPE